MNTCTQFFSRCTTKITERRFCAHCKTLITDLAIVMTQRFPLPSVTKCELNKYDQKYICADCFSNNYNLDTDCLNDSGYIYNRSLELTGTPPERQCRVLPVFILVPAFLVMRTERCVVCDALLVENCIGVCEHSDYSAHERPTVYHVCNNGPCVDVFQLVACCCAHPYNYITHTYCVFHKEECIAPRVKKAINSEQLA